MEKGWLVELTESIMYSKALTDLKLCDEILGNILADENEIDIAAFHLAQFLEKMLKHYLDTASPRPIEYAKEMHPIRALYEKATKIGRAPEDESLREIARPLERWATATRYNSNLGITRDLVNERRLIAVRYVNKLLSVDVEEIMQIKYMAAYEEVTCEEIERWVDNTYNQMLVARADIKSYGFTKIVCTANYHAIYASVGICICNDMQGVRYVESVIKNEKYRRKVK